MSMQVKESDIEKSILNYLDVIPETFAWKNVINSVITVKGKKVLKKQRVTGIADLTVIYKGRTMFWEIKRPGGKQTSNQKEFERNVTVAGGQYFIVKSLDEARSILRTYSN